MSLPAPVFDRLFLERAERTYRQQLIAHPEDTELRLRLAWCLFMQALYQSGQEAALSSVESNPDNHANEGHSESAHDRDSQALLKDCLQQTFTVMHVSIRSGDRPDAEKIQELARLSGKPNVLDHAQNRAAFILSKLTREMLNVAEASTE